MCGTLVEEEDTKGDVIEVPSWRNRGGKKLEVRERKHPETKPDNVYFGVY